ncbi:hypothetical protein GCM10009840_03660 [Pseudolysinimonas kribbensis]|uniref:histidine kinase n=1 Tax=Pseudolysinimonas kribbensis TaxID=433641 RepID=A0ABQ6K2Z3_9MICO|nr:HAMP domain-containing sensor histidine kinase [Pseudolysinimonas kribbensis]GMA94679.1 hypothetical protein GCM10025881_15030 [Pseudolysinimonas kribbensis]
MTRQRPDDPDERAIRRASLIVGLQITGAATILVVVVVVVAFAFVLDHIRADRLFSHREATIDIGGLDIIEGAIIIGGSAVILAAALSWFATRRAVRPLGEALHSQRAFVANASHELRTPLAVLDTRLQTLQRKLSDDDVAAPTVIELRRDTATLVQIVNDLLEAAEDGPASDGIVLVNPVIALAVESLQLLGTERDITVTFTDDEEIHLAVPAPSIHRCVIALVDNAMKFSPPGSTVEVGLRSDGPTAELSVKDQGSGIRGIDPGAIFDRFARGTEVGDRAGFGIGLSLVRDTVQRAGGSVRVEATGPQGTEIVIRLPRADAPRRRRRS